MAENVNVGAIAEDLAHDLFYDFYWEPIGRMNHDWTCQSEEVHGAKTHPCDVVFYYDEPYEQVRTYLHVDLKSYSKASLSKKAVEDAIFSLAKQVSCANLSVEWQDEHSHSHHQASINGMLFIYNHDGEYDAEFSEILDRIELSSIILPSMSRIYVIGPEQINWFQLIKLQMQHYRGASRGFHLPSRENCLFHYPQLSRKINLERRSAKAATLEALMSPWLMLKYQDGLKKGYVVFYNRKASTVEELIYLLDYLRYYRLLDQDYGLMIVFRSEYFDKAIKNLQKAKQKYLEEADSDEGDSALKDQVKNIEFDKFVKYSECYSADEIGMDYGR